MADIGRGPGGQLVKFIPVPDKDGSDRTSVENIDRDGKPEGQLWTYNLGPGNYPYFHVVLKDGRFTNVDTHAQARQWAERSLNNA